MSQYKNFKTIGLKMIDEFQKVTVVNQFFDDPRCTMSDVNMTCSLLRKELRKGYIIKSHYPKSIRCKAFYELVENLEKIILKMKTVQKRWKETHD